MFLFFILVGYELSREHWGKDFDINDLSMQTTACLNTCIVLAMLRCEHYKYTDVDCWEEICESMEGQTLDMLEKTSRLVIKELCRYLLTYGVWVKRQASAFSFAKIVLKVFIEET